jgi:hypothetical protein
MILEWIHECETVHDECRENESIIPGVGWTRGDNLPTRLLFVGSGPDDILHLVESSQLVSDDAIKHALPRYAALSHMWGNIATSRHLKATRTSYDELRRSIGLHDLPPTFQDAVLVCRALGYLYLWIDSLCIIQDDVEDWNREAALMHRVYRMAHVTVVAYVGHRWSKLFSGLSFG